MIQIKNLRGGWLFIPDAGLKLKAGQVASVKNLTPQIEGLIDMGYVAKVDSSPRKKARSRVQTKKLPTVPKESAGLQVPEAKE